jgi:hypothetical protein
MLLADYCRPEFLEQMIRRHAPQHDIRVLAARSLPVDTSASILAVLTAGQSECPVGHAGLEVTFTAANTAPRTQRLVLKVKPPGAEVSAMLNGLAQACGGELAAIYPLYATRTGFHDTHHRELELYQHQHALMPRIWGLHHHDERAEYAILMEHLEEVELLNSVLQPEQWTDAHLRAALDQLAAWHARHLQPAGAWPAHWPNCPSGEYMQTMAPLWRTLLEHAARQFPTLYDPARVKLLEEAITHLPAYWDELAAQPHTLVHNDLNPRNTCFRRHPNGTLQFCAYDWELATYHVPAYDVVELLAFVLDPDRYDQRLSYLDYYRQCLHARTGHYPDAGHFRRIAGLAALDFGLHRLGMYLMAHTVSRYPYLPRVVHSYFDTLAQLQPAQTWRGLQPAASTQTQYTAETA